MSTFNAWYLEKSEGGFQANVRSLPNDALLGTSSPGDVVIQLDYSTINYKDGLALTNASPVVRLWPMVPGIDGAGTVIESTHPRWIVGDKVIHNGWGVGETAWGCLAQRARLKGDGLVALPSALTTQQAMTIGTAGYTAALCVNEILSAGITPDSGEVLVTGATGGVGSIAVALLATLGFKVVAATGKMKDTEYLEQLGAANVIDRATLSQAGKPLQKERWAAVVDAVGSHTLANACAQMKYGGVAAACGLAQGMDFPASVAPFILRGVKLIGVDSVMAPMSARPRAWDLLAKHLNAEKLARMVRVVSLQDALPIAQAIMRGEIRGRVVVDVNQLN
jgi:acrylyl-CoA reductase (NADPH)